MVEAFSGKWQVDTSATTGFDEYSTALGYTQERINMLKGLSYTIEFTSSGDLHTVNVVLALPGNPTQNFSFKLGEEFDYKSLDGEVSKLTITLDGGKFIESYRKEDNSKQKKTTREVHGDTMTVTSTAEGAVLVQTLKRV